MTIRKSWHLLLLRLYENLTRNDQVRPVDLIFVMAGRMDRKLYGLELFRAGLAPRLVLSVGRFEVSKMKRLQIPGCDELIVLRDQTPPDERYFLVDMDAAGVRLQKVKLARWNTYGEALGFRDYLKGQLPRRVMVISTDIHLRRVALTFSKVFHDMPIKFIYCPVPPQQSCLKKDLWWTRRDDRRYVLKETIKRVAYRIILRTTKSRVET